MSTEAPGMCMNVAPGRVAACWGPDADGMLRTPWCHLPDGHHGPHVCGELRWEDRADESKKTAEKGKAR